MLRGLIAFCLLRRPLVLIAFGAFLGLGFVAFSALNIEAYPDPAPPIIEIIAQRPGQSPEEMERYVTVPIEIAIASTPGLRYIRSNTVYALSFIRLQFEYGRDYHFVRQQTINRLREADLPQGVQPVISPAGTISEIFRYELKGPPGMDVMQLKTLQDWVVERRLRMVPGVADVLVLGGKTKEFQAEIDLNRMRAFGVSMPQIINAISTNNANVGGRTIAMGEQAVNVRGVGIVRSLEDIGNIVLTQEGGLPVLISDVAKMQIGFTPRLGIAGRDGTTDIVTGIVLMQKFERTMDVVQRVRAAVARMNADGTLPPGVHIHSFYDRGDLVAVSVRTVLNNMLFGVVLIFLIQWIFLGDLRSALIVSATIPAALFLAVIITVLRGESANLLSIGAIDLGIIVDATVIMVENVFRHLAHAVRRQVSDPETRLSEKLRRILAAAVEVDRPIFFSVIITIAAFLPLFTMQGVEGQIFGPMSRTYAYVLLGAVIATFTVTPVIASLLLPERVTEVETFVVRQIRKVYQFVLPLAVRRYRLSAMIALAFLAICGLLASRLGTEFLPKLEEGNLWIRGMMPPTMALDAGIETVARVRNIIRSYEPVRTVFSEQGRGEDGTDPDGSFLVEFFVPLKPFNEWPWGLTKQKLIAQMSERFNREIVGVDFNFSQYIQDNIEEAVSGVKGEMHFALTVRLAPQYRDNVDAIRTVPVAVPNADPKSPTTYIALNDVAEVKVETGASYIYRENSQRFIPLKYSVRDRDLGSTVAQAQAHLAQTVPLPQGYRMEWTGEFGALVEAKKRLALIVPLSLLLIMMLLYGLFNSVRDSLIALSGIPFAVSGGILGLYVAGLNSSVSAGGGVISLFGVSAMDGILLVSYIRRALEDGMGTEQAIISAGRSRMRQVFMTGLSACIGLLPAPLSTGIGSQAHEPFACVIVGGTLLAPICSLLVIPTLSRLLMPAIEATEHGSYAAQH